MNEIQFSRDASSYDYNPSSHGGNRRRERRIPMEAIDQAIEEGDAYQGHSGNVLLETKWSGAVMTVVIDPKSEYIVSTYWGTGKKLKTLRTQEERRKERERKVREGRGAAYTGAWM
ncbi:hypothetical protein M192_gp010 [Halorubrum tailed phage 8]|uniref:Uncharacterized protein n=2 Tax=Haloferacalesvirus TaxID=2843389 RepID=R4T5H0_9CAUD|nr:hypothetical protein M192_gp010 [Halorubrum tailed phage 8]AGM10869.1 hypothetical protein HRTV8_125 [Halorubrum tailed phage 8]UBF19323.1 DUF4258 domain-containing protein [Halorubrum phage HRTV-17]